MNKAFLVRILISLQVFSSAVFAQVPIRPTGCNGYVVAFGNGIMSTPSHMQKGRLQLQKLLGNTYNGQALTYAIAENPSDGLLADLIRVMDQKIAEDASISWEIAFKVWLSANIGLIPTLVYTYLQGVLKDFINKAFPQHVADLRRKYEEEFDYIDSRVVDHVAKFKDMIKTEKRKVLLIAHSQGNLYANAAYRQVYQDPEIKTKSFGLVGVASPANFVAGDGPYMTSENDLVILAVRNLLSADTLPANIDIEFSLDDIQGHGFLPVYASSDFSGWSKLQEISTLQLRALDDPDDDDDLTQYKWFYAQDYRNEPGGPPPLNSLNMYIARNIIFYGGCHDSSDRECEEQELARRHFYNDSFLSIYSPSTCIEFCNDPEHASMTGGGRGVILNEGEFHPSENRWRFAETKAKQVLEDFVLPRVLSENNRAYLGFPRSDAKLIFLERDFRFDYLVWLGAERWTVPPEQWSHLTTRHTYMGIKNCQIR